MHSKKKVLSWIALGIAVSVCLMIWLGHIRHEKEVQRHLSGMELAWEMEVADRDASQRHRSKFKQHQKELVRLEYLQERWFEIPGKLEEEELKEMIHALTRQAKFKAMFSWSMGAKKVIKVIAHPKEMPEWEALLSRWQAVSVPVVKTPEKNIFQSLKVKFGLGDNLAFSEENLFGLGFVGDEPIEFTAKVVRIEDHSHLLAKDPLAVPYYVHFKLVEGTIPQFPNHGRFIFIPGHQTGIDSIGRFKESQEVVFVCSADGVLRGLKNVTSFYDLPKLEQEGSTGKGIQFDPANATPLSEAATNGR